MSLTAREHRLLAQIAVGLAVTDPALAAQLAQSPIRPRSPAAPAVATATALAAMIGGLPLTLATPLWGCCLSISGFIALSAATFQLSLRWHPLPHLRILLHHLTVMPGLLPGEGNG